MKTIIVGGVIEKNGKFLLVQEAKENCRGMWSNPAGHLEDNENLLNAAKREILEETGCQVELTGVLQIANRVLKDDTLLGIIFCAKLLEENISYNKKEILDVKWFSYEEIISMKKEIREFNWAKSCFDNFRENNIAPIDIVEILE